MNTTTSIQRKAPGSVVDLFCGAGGLSHGFKLEGFSISAGIDLDEECRYPYEKNNDAPFINADISQLDGDQVKHLFHANQPRILIGCAPCQPFSAYSRKQSDSKWKLVDDFARIIDEITPEVVSMENVPRLLHFGNGEVFRSFISLLNRKKYWTHYQIVRALDYGVPQNRSRLVLLSSRLGPISLQKPELGSSKALSLGEAILDLPPLTAGGIDHHDLLHRASSLSKKNLERIRASRPGGTWRNWDEDLRAACHRRESGKSYPSVYGRAVPNEPAPTITTQFYGFGNGRFGHPHQDRALSLREGAILQSFPRNYEFVEPGKPVRFKSVGRLIGNAVPVLLGRAIARSVRLHLDGIQNEREAIRTNDKS